MSPWEVGTVKRVKEELQGHTQPAKSEAGCIQRSRKVGFAAGHLKRQWRVNRPHGQCLPTPLLLPAACLEFGDVTPRQEEVSTVLPLRQPGAGKAREATLLVVQVGGVSGLASVIVQISDND
ncbi:hypothetical protein P7K49_030192 [Saguinus oedipus]|uniref:Uncharacterized protein n=1 Tax=Saguinus oedipus TaxID=9490 RepID=A0ABQ9U2N3_SAGOE|nr:hypothetical protein P7K49_030192 [Saguinus oedipus]